MTDPRPVCIPCTLAIGKVTRFFPARNGFNVPYGYDGILSGDLYACPICGAQIVVGWAIKPHYPEMTPGTDPRSYLPDSMKGIGDSDIRTHTCTLLDSYKKPLHDGENFPLNIYIPKTNEALQYVFTVNEDAWYADFGALGVVARGEVVVDG